MISKKSTCMVSVALLAEGVDRNISRSANAARFVGVALLAEGVDRNYLEWVRKCRSRVALLAEGVDRNRTPGGYGGAGGVALLAEGVDRNFALHAVAGAARKSPSSRRAWIEILRVNRAKKSSSCRPPRGGRG